MATGTKMNETNEGKITTTQWKTETPLPVVGFSLGEFEMKEAKIGTALAGQLTVDAYANTDRPGSGHHVRAAASKQAQRREAPFGSASTLRPCSPAS